MNDLKFELTGNDNLDMLLTKINYGADINIKDDSRNTALIRAAYHGRMDICKILIENGVDINMQNLNGNSALMRAAFNGYIDIVKLLIENNADINIQNNDGDTALIWGSIRKNKDICKLLVENGADINIKNNSGYTPIDSMENEGIYKEVNPYKIIGLKYFKEVFKENAESYMDIFNTTLYSQDLELEDIKANIEMFYSTIVARTDNNVINENVEL